MDFCADLSTRFSGSLQISSDGHPAYKMAVGANFDLDRTSFAQLVKIYGQDDKGHDVCIGSRKEPVFGTPDIDLVSTSYVERSNLMLRTINRRYTRLTNAFSKKLENHGHMIALGLFSYNFCTKHGTLKTSPAVAAGVAGHVWKMDEVVLIIDRHFADKENEKFAAAFAAMNTTQQRTGPKTFTPTPKDQIPTPWYLQGFKDSAPGDSELP